jgi:RNAse (barnase) inhibitor barstar
LPKALFELDGSRFSTLEGFYEEVSRVIVPGQTWGHNLDAFDELLSGRFGTPESGFRLVWRNHILSREALGHAETVRQLALRIERSHPTNRAKLATELAAARNDTGPTVFDWLVEILGRHHDIELELS